MFSMEIIHFYQKSISLAPCIFWREFMPFIWSSDLILIDQKENQLAIFIA